MASQPKRPGPWRPRASGVGAYMKCLWRAAQDRLHHEGQLPPGLRVEQEDTRYADFGTCCHFNLQDGMRCVFPKATEEEILTNESGATVAGGIYRDGFGAVIAEEKFNALMHAPTEKQWTSASKLFGDNIEVTKQRARECAALGAQHLPKTPTGKPWQSEGAYENEFVTGHVDFLSPCGAIVGDLKTTTKPPVHQRVKVEHQAQLALYHILTGAPRGFVLYVDSLRASWTTICWMDFTDPNIQFYVEQVEAFCRMLIGPNLLPLAFPSLDHQNCTGSWCPYTASCYDKMTFPRGREINAITARRPTGPLRLSVE